ncbi:MAG: GTP-binding protein [Victivallales bacterium]|nr:GTP-binding protein [Victivallales bacterium]
MTYRAPASTCIRNIGIIAHIDAGKTTVTERFLFYSGKTHRIGDVDGGNTVMDFLDEERSRGITISAAAASFEWTTVNGKSLIHLIDTPGHIDFTAEVERALRVIDGAVVIFSGVEGVEAQSEKVWRQSDHYKLPRIAFINKLDRLGASFENTVSEIKEKFPAITPVALQIPIGIESELNGVIDLINMQAVFFTGEEGAELIRKDIPAELTDAAELARDDMIAALANNSGELAELYIEGLEVPATLIRQELRQQVLANIICPVLCGSAKKNIGIQPLLDAVADYLPAPDDCPQVTFCDPKSGEESVLDAGDDNFYALVFKVVAGTNADLYYMRIYNGILKLNDVVVNPRTREKIKIKRMLRLYARNVEAREIAEAGDIIGVMGTFDLITGDTLCCVNKPMLLEKISFPEPVISMAIEPRSTADKDKLKHTLELLCREDPTLFLDRHESTGQMLLSGMGELHLEINFKRIKDEFHIESRCGQPRVTFRETLPESCSTTGIFDRLIGDKELYCEVDVDFFVEKLDCGHKVENLIKSKNIPSSWIHSAETALEAGVRTGGVKGYSLTYVRAVLKDLRGTQDRTTDAAVAGAVLDAVSRAVSHGTILLEPLMKLEISAPEECIGEISGYLQARRAVIHHIGNIPSGKRLSCEVPLAEMFGFSKSLPQLSGGRASFSMEPHGFQPISEQDMERLAGASSAIF